MSLSLQLLHREEFESRTLRALLGGAGAAVLGTLAQRMGLPVDPAYAAVVGASLIGSRPRMPYTYVLRLALVVLPLFPYFFDAPTPVTQGFAGATAGALLAWLGRGHEEVGTLPQVGASAVASGLLTPLGTYVLAVLHARLFGGAPGLLPALVGLTAVALFWSIGTLPAHLRLHFDSLEARAGELEPRLQGETRDLVRRALALYRQCKALASKLAASPGRAELLGTLEKMVREALELATTHAGLEAQLESVVQVDVDQQVKDLRARAAATEDGVARRQLELAASSLGEELNRLETLGRRKERLMAQLHAQVALLERARVSLVGAQSAEMGDKGAQAAQLAQRLAALGQEGAPPPPAPAEATAETPPPPSTRVSG
ncbi:hypothetical protein P2318_00985 [Myxococcaceae bacterium GXIMD 01537]